MLCHFLGTDASERWSVAEFRDYARARFAGGQGWTYRVLERNIERHPNGQVYWFDEVLLNAALGRCRGTGVIVREDGRWKVAHYSLSLLVPNDIADRVGALTKAADGIEP